MRPSLSADGQRRFLEALRRGEDLDRAFSGDIFLHPPGDTRDARWNIYKDGYVIRLAEAIGNDYPALQRIAGPAAFTEICRRYLAVFPPSSHDIGQAGADLAGYLSSDPVAGRLPFLPDLARFEWALAEAIVAPDVQPLTWHDVAGLGAERLADLPLRAVPGTATIRSRWPLADLWLTKDLPDEAIDIDLEAGPTRLLVWRNGLDPRWRTIDDDDAALIDGALAGSTPALILDSGAFGTGIDAPRRLVAALRRLVELGSLAPPDREEQ